LAAQTTAADPAEVAKFDALAHRFWDERGDFRPLHLLNPLRAEFVATRSNLAAARALDVGCGGGLLAEALCRAGARVSGIDLAPGMIEVARLHAAGAGLAIDYQLASADEFATRHPAQFDVVTCMEMLEHVPQPGQVLASLATLVRPGGSIFVSTLNRNLRAFLVAIVGAEYLARFLPAGTHEYERFIRPSELAAWGRDAGLELLELAGLEFDPLTSQCRLTRSPDVNYLVQFRKP
jgi:2-polyprenyl-6-hydroxyphenyl methylase/3-demethylubiquinone-9 3-methyltransferase